MEEPATQGDVTRLLRSWADGDSSSLNAVIPIVYEELRQIARRQLGRSGMRRQLHTTLLVHEAFEKLVATDIREYRDRRHFFAVAARAMRQIVVDSYRSKMAAKRGGGMQIDIELQTGDLVDGAGPEKVLELSEAVDRLADENPELAEVLELSCFAGLSTEEIAELHETTVRTVQRKLVRAKAWVHHMLGVV